MGWDCPVTSLTTTRNSVALSFALNGLFFATLVSRLPDVRGQLDLANGELGLLLLSSSVASMVALPLSGRLIERFTATGVVRGGATLDAIGVVVAAFGATVVESVPITALGLFVYGLGLSVWDVAMNVEGAEVERRLGRTVMPRFHAAWSLGSITGAALGIPMAAAHVPMVLHIGIVSVLALAAALWSAGTFLPTEEPEPSTAGRPVSAWREPRTLAIGVMVLAFATVEGSANDWLSLALIDGYGVAHWVGVAGFSLFVTAMTVGRLVGPVALDRFGRAPVLWATSAAAAAGTLLVVYGGHWVPVGVGILVWGLGASLGFPVGMSAAADDPARAAARVSVVSTIGYGSFLAGPPLLGFLGSHFGVLNALLVVSVVLVPSAFAVPAARKPAHV